jgi:hypothetical protein
MMMIVFYSLGEKENLYVYGHTNKRMANVVINKGDASFIVLALVVLGVSAFYYYLFASSSSSYGSLKDGGGAYIQPNASADTNASVQSTQSQSPTSQAAQETDAGSQPDTSDSGEFTVDTGSAEPMRGERATALEDARQNLSKSARILKERCMGSVLLRGESNTAKSKADQALRDAANTIKKKEKQEAVAEDDSSDELEQEDAPDFDGVYYDATSQLFADKAMFYGIKPYATSPAVYGAAVSSLHGGDYNVCVDSKEAMHAQSSRTTSASSFVMDFSSIMRPGGIEYEQALELDTDHSFDADNFAFASGEPVTPEDFENQSKDWAAKKAAIKPAIDEALRAFSDIIHEMFPKLKTVGAHETDSVQFVDTGTQQCIDFDRYESFVNWSISKQLGGSVEIPSWIKTNPSLLNLREIEKGKMDSLKKALLGNCNDILGYRIDKKTGAVFSRTKKANIEFQYLWPKDGSVVSSRPFTLKKA